MFGQNDTENKKTRNNMTNDAAHQTYVDINIYKLNIC